MIKFAGVALSKFVDPLLYLFVNCCNGASAVDPDMNVYLCNSTVDVASAYPCGTIRAMHLTCSTVGGSCGRVHRDRLLVRFFLVLLLNRM